MLHQDLARGRWQEMPLTHQLANIGAEFQRLITARKSGNSERSQQAKERLLELLDMSIANQEGPRRNELKLLREVLIGDAVESLQSYFMNFALLVRK